MDNVKEIIKMLDAGYSREEIAEILAEKDTEQVEDTEPAENVSQEAQEEPQEAKPDPMAEYAAEIQKLADEVKSLRAQLQKKNIQQTQIIPEKQDSAVDVLARVINPNYGKEFNSDGGKIR